MAQKYNRRRYALLCGGGSKGGGAWLLGSALATYDVDYDIICGNADSGSSTGRAREEFPGSVAVGDTRQGIAVRLNERDRLFLNYRFPKGALEHPELAGHSNGNVMLLAGTHLFGPEEGLRYVAGLYDVKPPTLITYDDIHLKIRLSDGEVLERQGLLNDVSPWDTRYVAHVWLEPKAYITKRAGEILRGSDVVVTGATDLIGNLGQILNVNGISEGGRKGVDQAIREGSVKKVIIIANLMSKWETQGFTVADHLKWILQWGIGRKKVDGLILNSNWDIPKEVKEHYKKQSNSVPVEAGGYADLRAFANVIHPVHLLDEGALKEGLIRHDPQKLGRAILELDQALHPEPMHPLPLAAE